MSSRRRSRRRTRRIESAAVWAFLPVIGLVPLWLVALAAVWFPLGLVVNVTFPVFIAAHLAGSMVLFVPTVQRHLFTRLLGTRPPTPVEVAVLDHAWQTVARVAGVDHRRFVLSITDDDELNAFACGGHMLVVSSFAVRELPSDELSGVLAHELSHHLGSHTVALTIGQWMSLPIIALARLGWFLQNVAQAATTTFTRRSSIAEAMGQVVAAVLRSVAVVLTFGLTAATTMGHVVGKGAEFQADRRAAELGFGPELGRALRRALSSAVPRRAASFTQRLAASHPPLRTRAARLEAYLRRGHHPSMGPLPEA
jgi:Zn-dependent protease with chaperone function